jgi:hypothetical protein
LESKIHILLKILLSQFRPNCRNRPAHNHRQLRDNHNTVDSAEHTVAGYCNLVLGHTVGFHQDNYTAFVAVAHNAAVVEKRAGFDSAGNTDSVDYDLPC